MLLWLLHYCFLPCVLSFLLYAFSAATVWFVSFLLSLVEFGVVSLISFLYKYDVDSLGLLHFIGMSPMPLDVLLSYFL